MIITLQVIGLSHSEILGSKDICSYPKLIAAYHVLHRLREPRHPPEALTYFRHNQLILLAVVEISRHLHIKNIEESNDSVQFYYKVLKLYYSLVYQYVKDLFRFGTPTVSGAGLAAPALSVSLSGLAAPIPFLTKTWRITDSNR